MFSSFVEGKTAETDLALACPALCPDVAPLLTELLLLVAALDLLNTRNSVLNHCVRLQCDLYKDDSGKARKLQLQIPNFRQ